jgi:two-component system sporulation sensor kinase B
MKGVIPMVGYDYLILNFLFILVSVFAFFSFGLYKSKMKSYVFAAICSIDVLFCMTFPFTIIPGFMFDLRIVPFLLSILYGGVGSGFLVAIVLITYRYFLGGDGLEVTIYSYIPILFISIPFITMKKPSSSQWRIFTGTSLAFVSASAVATICLITFGPIRFEYLEFFVYYCGLVTLCMWMTVYVIEMMKENMEMREELQRKEKLQVLGELAASMAHEIRSPLTVASGFVQLLGSRLHDEINIRYINYVLESLDKSESIISDYLMYSKPQAEKIGKIDITDQFQNVLNLMEPFITANGHELYVQLEKALFTYGEPKKFSQAILNILENAVEAMEHSGKLCVQAYKEQGQITIDISDTGIGMTEEQIIRLGDPFYSTKEKGTGLGLMVTYRIIGAMGGKLNVQSKKGKGTKFTIIIPCIMN